MNPISAFFVRNIVAVFFVYGLAFFVLGVALALSSRRASEFRFARVIPWLAAFGILHGIHEWVEMFQKIAALTSGYIPATWEEAARVALLVLSFLMLLAFGVSLLNPGKKGKWPVYRVVLAMVGVWGLSVVAAAFLFKPSAGEMVGVADALARYSLGIPAALLGTWALMAQQRTFREHNMPQFGRDLVWCAAALCVYGVVGQLFVRQTLLFPSTVFNSQLFLQWFGIPVQLFRAMMAIILTFYMVRALRAFELENRRRLDAAHRASLEAQTAALEAERRVSREMERLNEELRLTTRELSLLLDLSNMLAAPMSLHDRLYGVLKKIVESLSFPEAGLIILVRPGVDAPSQEVLFGFAADNGDQSRLCKLARELGEQCIAKKIAMCRHKNGQVVEFFMEDGLAHQECRRYQSPTLMVSLPLAVRHEVIGSIVLVQPTGVEKRLSFDEFKLMLGIAQQLGLSIENARLYQEAQKREKILAELLHQVVGAQESERKRIARELHDATGQSLTAITLGLRGIENLLVKQAPNLAKPVGELRSFGVKALGELRQIIADLRPSQLDDLGLVAALHWYVTEFKKRNPIDVEFVNRGKPARLPSEYETVLFRIAQEALINMAKYSYATTGQVRLETDPTRIQLVIEDNGRGFNPELVLQQTDQPVGWGLLGILERTQLLGGHCHIDSSPGRGTRIHVTIPLMMEMKDAQDTAVAG